jgi:hypothetical protein
MKKNIRKALTMAFISMSILFLQRCNEDGSASPIVKPPQASKQISHFPFSGNMKDVVGTHTPTDENIKNLLYGKDRFGNGGRAGEFDGTTTLVEIPNADGYLINSNLTVSFWMNANSTKDGQFIIGLAGWKGFYFDIASDWSSIKMTTQYALAGGESDSEDILFAGTGETNDNGGWQGYTFQKEVAGGIGNAYLKDKWVHVVTTYEATTRLSTMYLNGEKVMQTDFNLWPMDNAKRTTIGVVFAGNINGGGNNMALGFIQGANNRIITESWADPADLYSNHFKGLMDDLRIFSVALTETEVAKLYHDEK